MQQRGQDESKKECKTHPRGLGREGRHWGETTVPKRHRRRAASHGQQRVSARVPTPSQPALRFNLRWHDTGSMFFT